MSNPPGSTRLALFGLVSFALTASGCLGAMTPAGRAQQAVQDMNQAAGYGRLDIAVEQVTAAYRSDFSAHHAGWGTRIRVLDYEVAGLSMKKSDRAEATVSIGWQRADETEMRLTQIRQHWVSRGAGWLLDGEERIGGDVGLWGEGTVTRAEPTPHADAQFHSITIR